MMHVKKHTTGNVISFCMVTGLVCYFAGMFTILGINEGIQEYKAKRWLGDNKLGYYKLDESNGELNFYMKSGISPHPYIPTAHYRNLSFEEMKENAPAK